MMTSINLAATAMLIGGAGESLDVNQVDDAFDAWEKAVKSVVEDDEKKTQAVAIIKSVREEAGGRRAQMADAVSAYLTMDASYDASAEDYEASIETLNRVWSEQEQWLIDRRFELRRMLTEDEWLEALKQVDAVMSKHLGKLSAAQKLAREKYEKKQSKVEN